MINQITLEEWAMKRVIRNWVVVLGMQVAVLAGSVPWAMAEEMNYLDQKHSSETRTMPVTASLAEDRGQWQVKRKEHLNDLMEQSQLNSQEPFKVITLSNDFQVDVNSISKSDSAYEVSIKSKKSKNYKNASSKKEFEQVIYHVKRVQGKLADDVDSVQATYSDASGKKVQLTGRTLYVGLAQLSDYLGLKNTSPFKLMTQLYIDQKVTFGGAEQIVFNYQGKHYQISRGQEMTLEEYTPSMGLKNGLTAVSPAAQFRS